MTAVNSNQGTGKLSGRVGIVGTGHRARLYTTAVASRANTSLVALCDTNDARMDWHNKMLREAGRPEAKKYAAEDFQKMLEQEKLDVLVVTTIDYTHDMYIIPALKAGIKVLSEKPMTTNVDKCKAILNAVDESNGSLTVLFNYRYNPIHWKVAEVISKGEIGEVKSVHFEWLLDTVHGADYFRRWHRYKDRSGGLMIHKSSHHFDLVNFWIQSVPQSVFGMGSLAFYGKENGKKSGWGRSYERARDAKEAENDPFAIHLGDEEGLKGLYFDAEHIDGYHRDMNVFADDITIEDDMSVLVHYESGVNMTYHLTAYSPWEGYRVMFNGTHGRLELEVVENAFRLPIPKGSNNASEHVHGDSALPNEGHSKIILHKLWQQPVNVPYQEAKGGHGGGDEAMLDEIFGPKEGEEERKCPVNGLSADQKDGALAMAVGLAANESFKSGKQVFIKELLGGTL
ncbi:oxidoreductase [Cryptococcus neoformans C23]|uniref:Oxidoreductase n=2 Tax=Cryptococcus neoformans TaxID=5207 RepID=A0A854QEX4_CRYNE|nr:oxidoreductase [Cryptococcus neoformans var. grubii H99]AUB24330.1 oxidoreductase [Cryptococcus neoformans var. grubii]OWZ32101.1 oxidoreductase [Cryptococcus neoformans var. grubii AD2-60a]OWZ44769.1 oxidoreductase [Cryptococcus neoformans var. grubii C23]OWZ45364.1 oxidoreductase [Cryptococcus neoformans var. grubii AD1-83a]OWZ53758.1 oxidoreductase [Cryptococcus neoformans var. grubii 125.91]OXC85228.1 oxidoreductase [Cryptococcus neoformans var. grubii AD1-7a]OXG22820.1 oxidoreductase|eukprot:XP_012049586.1 oxidoreductase [Cryptococcus neoformans var. grubii H99]